jgi:hypothetical protein
MPRALEGARGPVPRVVEVTAEAVAGEREELRRLSALEVEAHVERIARQVEPAVKNAGDHEAFRVAAGGEAGPLAHARGAPVGADH